MSDNANKILLLTGGTGSLGQHLTSEALRLGYKKVIVFSRHEHLQVEMKRKYGTDRVRYFLGDVRDRDRLLSAFRGVHHVVHAAAIKHVDMVQYNPIESTEINVMGAKNIILAAIERGVEKVLAISTDKSVKPVNLYGAQKLCADFLFTCSNAYSPTTTKFSSARFGNFWNSRGSVVEYFSKLKEQGLDTFPVTDFRMDRYFIYPERAAALCFQWLEKMEGGEIFVPKMILKKIVDVAMEIHPDAKLVEVGMRYGEKLHEDLVSNEIVKEEKDYWITR